jgi:hypothetical protein
MDVIKHNRPSLTDDDIEDILTSTDALYWTILKIIQGHQNNNHFDEDSVLKKSPSGRWTLGQMELTSGSRFDVNIAGHWIRIRIEHDHHDGYYAIPPAVRLHEGLKARLI